MSAARRAAAVAVLLGVIVVAYFAYGALAAPPLAAPTITVSPPSPSASTSASFSFTGPGGTTFECRFDSAAVFTACTSPKSYTSLSLASHTFRVRSVKASQTSSETSYTWSVVAPAVPTITSMPANPTNQTTASFAFTTNASNATFICKLDAGVFAACTSPKSYSGLSAASHTFQVEAVGVSGSSTGTSAPASYTWLIDTTPPGAPSITSGPTGATASTIASFDFTGEAGASFQCALDSTASPVACTSPKSYSGLAQGAHTFYVRQTDAAGNTGTVFASRSWTVDTVVPPKPSLSGPASPTSATSATFTFSDGEAGVTFQCSLDEGLAVACASPKTYTGLAVGSHELKVVAVDAAGNMSKPAEWAWTITTQQGQPYVICPAASPCAVGPISPGGAAAPINVTFSSPNSGNGGSGVNGTQVSSLVVSITSVTGGSTGPNSCTAADYVLTQFSGAYPFYVPFGSSSLSSIGFVNSATWPSIRMLNRADTIPGNGTGNQNACKGATVHLSFVGTP